MTGTVLFYTIFLFGNQVSQAAMPMDSPAACEVALKSFQSSGFVKNIQAAGGNVIAGCR